MRRILIVEDCRDTRCIFRAILSEAGYSVEEAEDGVAGLEAIERFKPELVLLNVMMPRMDGISMLAELRKRRPRDAPKVVMMSASLHRETFDLAVRLGAYEYLCYPFDSATLKQVVAETLDLDIEGRMRMRRAELLRILRHTLPLSGCGLASEFKSLRRNLKKPDRLWLRDELLKELERRGVGKSGPVPLARRQSGPVSAEVLLMALAGALEAEGLDAKA